MTALHPEATADPQTLRWVTTPGALPVIGSVDAAPAPLAELLDEGLVTSLTAGPAWVDVALDPDQTWRSAGPRVRSALLAALELPEQWHVVAPDGASLGGASESDPPGTAATALQTSLAHVLDGRAGDYIRSHGGRVSLDTVTDDQAWLTLTGACRSCPALVFTVQGTIARELERCHRGPFRLHVNGRLCASRDE